MELIYKQTLDYDSVLIKPQSSRISSRSQVTLTREFKDHNENIWFIGVPIIAANMTTIGTLSMLNALAHHECMTAVHKYIPEEKFGSKYHDYYGWYTLGICNTEFEKLVRVSKVYPDSVRKICIDIANGYLHDFIDFIKKVHNALPKSIIMAGNVIDEDGVRAIIGAGATVVKVGVGPGSVCETRKVAGIGYPQLSAVIECAEIAHKLGAYICADGGCTNTGDICKAFAAGADFVMLGGMLAGHNECEGEVVNGKMKFYGMSSNHAMDLAGIKNAYRASEGKLVEIPCRGAVTKTIEEILGGLRSCCTYSNAENLQELQKNAILVTVPKQYNTIFGV